MVVSYYRVSVSIRRLDAGYHVELSHNDPSSDAEVAPSHGRAELDLDRLRELSGLPKEYGAALSEQLFGAGEVRQRFLQVEAAAQASASFLRVCISIDPSAPELLSLRWELLGHPSTGAPLGSSETTLLSRWMSSDDWRPVRLRAKAAVRALAAVSAPTPASLQRLGLGEVDGAAELQRARLGLAGVDVRGMDGSEEPLTLDRLIDGLRGGVDVFYLVSHGMFGRHTGTPALILQDASGAAAPILGQELTARISELQHLPLLVVLASCQSAGDGEQGADASTAQATLAGRLAQAGVPAVIAMQGFITMETVARMMPVFFGELLRDGQIDRALAVARGRVRDRPDAWMPALFTRLKQGRLWIAPGFRGGKDKETWRQLIPSVARGKVVPILGPRLLEAVHGGSHATALRLAAAHGYPFPVHEWDDLPRVTSFMSVKESRFNVIQAYQGQLVQDIIDQHRDWLPPDMIPPLNKRPRLSRLLSLVGERRRAREDDPFRLLAELPASIYVTANFDPLMEWALTAQGRAPQQLRTAWRYRQVRAGGGESLTQVPSKAAPLVYHLFGAFGGDDEDSLVLTERDYFEYLIQANGAARMPAEVESALVDNSLLFLGFRLTDWHFRVLFRLMMSLAGRDRLKDYCHVAVQLDPDLQTMADVEGAKEHLAEYFGKECNIDVYWGSSEAFLRGLREQLDRAHEPVVADDEPDDDEDDDWGIH